VSYYKSHFRNVMFYVYCLFKLILLTWNYVIVCFTSKSSSLLRCTSDCLNSEYFDTLCTPWYQPVLCSNSYASFELQDYCFDFIYSVHE